MKAIFLSLFLFTGACFGAKIYSQATIFSFNLENETVGNVIRQIEKNSEFIFFYLNDVLDVNRRVNVLVQDQPVEKILDQLLEGTNNTYKISNRQITILKKDRETSPTPQQSTRRRITGIVSDPMGEPIIGANVLIKGTTNGSITDPDGNFQLDNVSPSAIILVSYIGYQPTEITTGNMLHYNIILKEDTQALDEIVIVSYGSQSKRRITGAVQTINTKELADLPVAQLSQKLQGKFAGVQINQSTGIPGQGMQIRIRGQASITAGSDPLYIVDGFPYSGNIANINPDEIENISILKDASSTSLYGSRAANGVVIITTKRAQTGTTNLNVSAYAGVQQIPQRGRPKMMNAQQFAQFKKEVSEENGWGVDEMFQNPSQYGKGTDWYDVVTRDAWIQNYSLSYSTAKDRFSTVVTAGFMSQEGVLLNSNYNRFSLRINTDYKFNDKIRIGFNVAPTVTTNKTPESDGTWYDGGALIQGAILTSPLAPYKNEDGSVPLSASGYGTADAPNWYNQLQVVKNTGKHVGLVASGFVEYEPVHNLILKTSANVDLGNSVADKFTPSTAGGIFNNPNEADASRISGEHHNTFAYTWIWENTANYKYTFGNHAFDLLGGFTMEAARSENGSMFGKDYPDNRIQTLNVAKTITGSTDIQEYSMVSVLARLNYHYNSKYLLSVAFRTDASSRFGVNNRWGNFPSVSAGWVVSDEKFMKTIKPISLLKLRASYGVVGNNNIGNYTQYATVTDNYSTYPLNDVIYSGKSLAGLNNTELGWETTKQWDLGFDLNLLNDRIQFGYDYYHKTTDNLLYNVDIPITSNFFNYITNIGKLSFWGHELTLHTKNLVGNFSWSTDLNVSFNDNKVLELGTNNAAIYQEYTITRVGERIGQLYALIWDGIYMNQTDFENSPKYEGAEVGMVKYKDINGDGIVENTDNDKDVFGRSTPKVIYGMTNHFYWKNFDLSIIAAGAAGHKLMNYQERFTTNLDGTFNVLQDLDKRWRSEENPGEGKYGKVISGTTDKERDWSSSKFFYNASYLSIKNITVGYNVPLKNNVIKGLRLYGSIQNVYVFTKYPGNNPESAPVSGTDHYAGLDRTTYPVPRTFSIGVNLNF